MTPQPPPPVPPTPLQIAINGLNQAVVNRAPLDTIMRLSIAAFSLMTEEEAKAFLEDYEEARAIIRERIKTP